MKKTLIIAKLFSVKQFNYWMWKNRFVKIPLPFINLVNFCRNDSVPTTFCVLYIRSRDLGA